ncbi:hypothetical protein HK104_001781 [Borealophlyctis nickersoniae]|nr:hypothetical protein HK104_001781 [Borealophlyctis nickersoniae]
MANKIDYVVIDAFTRQPFKGNPAAVILFPSDQPVGPDTLQKLACEFNLSETCFIAPQDASTPTAPAFHLRWFTPTVEIDLCGHGTLASAAYLYSHPTAGVDPGTKIAFHTRSGVLVAEQRANGEIVLTFPEEPCEKVDEAAEEWDLAARALGVKREEIVYVGRNRMDVLVEVTDAVDIETMKPDVGLLATVKSRCLILTTTYSRTRAAQGYHFISRVFAPQSGIPEDPVTGSAHCALAVHWSHKLGTVNQPMKAYQASPRGGELLVTWRKKEGKVELVGSAVAVAEGKIVMP